MKTIILDDEMPAIQLLSNFVNKVPFLQLQLASNNAFKVLDLLHQENTDLLLLDIEMPDITGIELLNSLKNPPLIIFTTAYEQYALKGYELDVVDYLVKPIRFERFVKGVNKAHKHLQLNNNDAKEVEKTLDFLWVKVEYQTVKILLSDILFIEGLKDYVKIVTKEGIVLTRLNLKGISQKLPSKQFIRIHRSFIVAVAQIKSFQKSHVCVEDKVLPIGETYRANLLELLE